MTAFPSLGASLSPGSPLLNIAIPVHNQERDLERNVRRLRAYLDNRFPFSARITIVDNASTDATTEIARRLALELPGVRARRIESTSRGRALRLAWRENDAPIVVCMDAGLSTGLDALLPLVAPLISGHSDLSVGSRIGPGANVVWGFKRQIVARGHNLLWRLALGTSVRDTQCDFKAMRADVARALMPLVKHDDAFLDTELIVLARRQGLRIHEVPVDWVDEPVHLLSRSMPRSVARRHLPATG